MDVFIVLQQMLVLLVMMMIGFFMYRWNWVDDHSCNHLSKLCVNVLNPCIIINGVLGKDRTADGSILYQNIIMMIVYFVILIILSYPLVKMLRVKLQMQSMYQLMLIFSNVGFMGIPVISSIYGQESIVYIVFYMLGYNFLLYTFGLYMAMKSSGQKVVFSVKRIFNVGVISSIIALIIFALNIQIPSSVGTFFNYMGNAVVPLSMMIIGTSVAQHGNKKFFTDIKIYVFSAVKMLVIPIVAALLLRFVPVNAMVGGVFILMLAMPVGSIVVMLAKESGADDKECTKGSVVTTLLSILTIPIVSIFLP